MSFFEQQGDDSNLQYDDAAFLYFIASALILGGLYLSITIISDWLASRPSLGISLEKHEIFKNKLNNLKNLNKRKLMQSGLLIKSLLLVVICIIFLWVHS